MFSTSIEANGNNVLDHQPLVFNHWPVFPCTRAKINVMIRTIRKRYTLYNKYWCLLYIIYLQFGAITSMDKHYNHALDHADARSGPILKRTRVLDSY